MCNSCLHANARTRIDPTKTKTLRQKFEGEMFKRFRSVKGKINDALINRDALKIKSNRGFEFGTDAAKAAAFQEWLTNLVYQGVLGVSQGAPLTTAADNFWGNLYIDAGYNRGLENAAADVRSQGATVSQQFIQGAFSRKIHADRIASLYLRSFSDLQGITAEMDKQIARILAEGLAQGLNPRDIAQQINNRVDKIGITRARTLARTEIIRAHSEASLNFYEEAQAEDVKVLAEFVTSGDSRVCPECASLEGRTYKISEARGLIPVHPNCRCRFVVVLVDPTGVKL